MPTTQLRESPQHVRPTARRERTARERARSFSQLAEEWRQATAHSSSLTEKAMHPAYQQIIGMGPKVVSLILRELERRPAQWFWALKAITAEDPVPPAARGNLQAMTSAWLAWGQERGYL